MSGCASESCLGPRVAKYATGQPGGRLEGGQTEAGHQDRMLRGDWERPKEIVQQVLPILHERFQQAPVRATVTPERFGCAIEILVNGDCLGRGKSLCKRDLGANPFKAKS
jgi:hypothetical protein